METLTQLAWIYSNMHLVLGACVSLYNRINQEPLFDEQQQPDVEQERSVNEQEQVQTVSEQEQSVYKQEQPVFEQMQSVCVQDQSVYEQKQSVDDDEEQSILLQLPDHLLVLVLQCCAYQPRTLFSAARAHSRLQDAAAVVASGITAYGSQQQAPSVVAYLAKHGQHVQEMDFFGLGNMATLLQLPCNLSKLSSLQFSHVRLQLAPGSLQRGVLQVGTPLKQLRLDRCTLLDGGKGLAAALRLLPTLQHVCCRVELPKGNGERVVFYSSVLQQLPHLTHLELAGMAWAGLVGKLQQGLSGATRMQHVQLVNCSIPYGSAGSTQLVSQLQHLTQLTHLSLKGTLQINTPTAACSALTASSSLHHLDISECTLPADVWEQVFPSDRYLPDLRVLDIGYVSLHPHSPAALDGSDLVGCCPGLQSLQVQGSQYSAGLLLRLKDLSGLQQLSLWPHRPGQPQAAQGLEAVCELTGLRQLNLRVDKGAEDLLFQLTKLRQLTSLEYRGSVDRVVTSRSYKHEGPDDEPVWQQVARAFLNHSLLTMVMRAHTALAENDGPRDTASDQHFSS